MGAHSHSTAGVLGPCQVVVLWSEPEDSSAPFLFCMCLPSLPAPSFLNCQGWCLSREFAGPMVQPAEAHSRPLPQQCGGVCLKEREPGQTQPCEQLEGASQLLVERLRWRFLPLLLLLCQSHRVFLTSGCLVCGGIYGNGYVGQATYSHSPVCTDNIPKCSAAGLVQAACDGATCGSCSRF